MVRWSFLVTAAMLLAFNVFAEEPVSSGTQTPADTAVSEKTSTPDANAGLHVPAPADTKMWETLTGDMDFLTVGKKGELLIAAFPVVGRVAVGHKTYGLEMMLPYADDWKFSTDDAFPINSYSAGLGISVTVKADAIEPGSTATQCMATTKQRVLQELGDVKPLMEKSNFEEPVLWRYEVSHPELEARHLRQFNLWTFKTKDNTCFKYRMSILTDHSPNRDKFVNRAIRYVASFQTTLKERLEKAAQEKKEGQNTNPDGEQNKEKQDQTPSAAAPAHENSTKPADTLTK